MVFPTVSVRLSVRRSRLGSRLGSQLLDEGVIGVFNNMPVILWSDAEFYVFDRAAWEVSNPRIKPL